MKRLTLIMLGLIFTAGVTSAQDPPKLDTDYEKLIQKYQQGLQHVQEQLKHGEQTQKEPNEVFSDNGACRYSNPKKNNNITKKGDDI